MLKEAEKGYLTINRRAMNSLPKAGIHHLFLLVPHGKRNVPGRADKAARLTGRQIRVMQTTTQSPDHPVLLAVPETEYLKCFLLQAV